MTDEQHYESDEFLGFYKDAVLVQNAANLSGVVHSFSKHLTATWSYARQHGLGSGWVNEHPACRLFCEQIVHLSERDGLVRYSHDVDVANRVVRKAAAAESVTP